MPHRNRKGQFVKGHGRSRARASHSTAMVRHTGGGGSRGSQLLVVREPSRSRAFRHARRAGSALLATSHITGPALMAAALGYAKRQGWDIPVIGELGEDLTIAIIGYAALKFNVVPSSIRKHVANATLAAIVLAAHEFGQTGNIPGLGKKEAKTSGAGKRGAGSHEFQSYEVK